jgi:hypothetical protein
MGDFKRNEIQGEGKFFWANRNKYEGEVKFGQADGYGIFEW